MSETPWKNNFHHVVLTVLFSFGYAILRYHIFKGVSWLHFPLFITNKGLALAAILLSCIACWKLSSEKQNTSFFSGVTAYILGCIHVLISLVILRPSYYENFFESEQLNFIGELNLLFGIFGFISYTLLALSFLLNANNDQKKKLKTQLNVIGLILISGHTFIMGYAGWLKPTEWPGYLPPISLIGFMASSFTCVIFFLKRDNLKNH